MNLVFDLLILLQKRQNKREFESKIFFNCTGIHSYILLYINIKYIDIWCLNHQFKWRWTVSNTYSKKTLFILFVFGTLCGLLVYTTQKVRLTFIFFIRIRQDYVQYEYTTNHHERKWRTSQIHGYYYYDRRPN